MGCEYFRILGISFIFNSIAIIFAQVMRSTENVKIPLFASLLGFGLNTLLNYLLIFGEFGFPEMGYIGAAIATAIARCVEFAFLLVITYAKRLPTASSIKQLVNDKEVVQIDDSDNELKGSVRLDVIVKRLLHSS